MEAGRPSGTALRVAIRRAAHQLLDAPRVLDDPIALRIIGPVQEATLRADPSAYDRSPFDRALRAFLVARSRVAEDALTEAVSLGVRQYVILGAGLDTFAYRNPHPDIRVFEVDHPATQAWKRQCLETAGIAPAPHLTYVPVDFEQQALAAELGRAGFRPSQPAWFSWLGVTPYLARAAVIATLRDIAQLAGARGGVAFDYGMDPAGLTILQRAVLAALRSRVKRAGEPFKSFFLPAELIGELHALGFHTVYDLGPDALDERYFAGRRDGLRVGTLGHMMVARRS